MSHLPKILAFAALIFLICALIIQQTVSQNQERVEIIENETRSTVTATKPVTSSANGSVSKPKDITDVSGETLGENVGLISLNDATFEELDTVPGVGAKTAQKIIDGRPWTNFEEVLNLISKRWREEARGKIKL